MNVHELIDKLQKIEDKEQDVFYYEKQWDDEHPTLSDLETVEPNTYKYVYNMKTGKMECIGIVIH